MPAIIHPDSSFSMQIAQGIGEQLEKDTKVIFSSALLPSPFLYDRFGFNYMGPEEAQVYQTLGEAGERTSGFFNIPTLAGHPIQVELKNQADLDQMRQVSAGWIGRVVETRDDVIRRIDEESGRKLFNYSLGMCPFYQPYRLPDVPGLNGCSTLYRQAVVNLRKFLQNLHLASLATKADKGDFFKLAKGFSKNSLVIGVAIYSGIAAWQLYQGEKTEDVAKELAWNIVTSPLSFSQTVAVEGLRTFVEINSIV